MPYTRPDFDGGLLNFRLVYVGGPGQVALPARPFGGLGEQQYKFSSVETPRKFVTAKLSIRKLMEIRGYGCETLQY